MIRLLQMVVQRCLPGNTCPPLIVPMKGRTKLAGSDILGILDGWVGLGMEEDAALVLVLFRRTLV